MIKRRDFFRIGTGGVLASQLEAAPLSAEPANADDHFKEPSQNVPVVRNADVIVCGGGPAGFAAAVSAARNGAKTTLIELHGCLGGVWTTGLLSNIIDAKGKTGIMAELMERLERSGSQYSTTKYDAEQMKWTLEEMCREVGVDIRLHTRVTAAYRNKKDHLDYIVTEGFSGREAWKAKVFIDATGNGDLAAQAGCGFDVGEPGTKRTQPMSLMVIIGGIKEEDLFAAGYIKGTGKMGSPSEDGKRKLHKDILTAGHDASYSMPSFFVIRKDMIALMVNHQYGVSATEADAISAATLEARDEVNKIVLALRKSGGIWTDMRIVTSAAQIGIREGRRIHGLYTLNKNDLINGAQFEDGVCTVTFTVDIHALMKSTGGGYGNKGVKVKPYQIPARSLISKDVPNLMMAGRCISGDFYAHASYRVTGNAVPMGEAAGRIAASAVRQATIPQNVKLV
jgi:hypothetical protein